MGTTDTNLMNNVDPGNDFVFFLFSLSVSFPVISITQLVAFTNAAQMN
jgi:hypothetical protein